MKKRMCIFMIAIALFVGFMIPDTVCAAEGSITVKTNSEEKVVIYKVPEDFSFTSEKLDEVQKAVEFKKYVDENGIKGDSKVKDEEGLVRFDSLGEGTYLISQNDVIQPFMVEIPMVVDGETVYHITSYPKRETENQDELGGVDEPAESVDENTDEKLPQTGQLNWPVPMLAISGLMLFATGWCVYYKKD